MADSPVEVPVIRAMLKNLMATETSTGDISISLYNLVAAQFAYAEAVTESPEYRFIEIDYTYEMARLPTAEKPWLPGESTASRLYFTLTQAGQDYLQGKTSPCMLD